jgi:hypothetical protein
MKMDEINLKNHLPRVTAPPDFEQRVLNAVAAKKKKKLQPLFWPAKIFRQWSFVGAAALFVVVLVAGLLLYPRLTRINQGPEGKVASTQSPLMPTGPSILTLTEPVDFREEAAGSQGPKVIYVLEPVNDRFLHEVIY